MTSGAPWSVKGIDPKAREVAKDLARRSGMTLGEWLNQMIFEEDGPEDAGSESYFAEPDAGLRGGVRTYYETPREPPARPEPLRASPSRFEAPEHPADEISRVTLALDRLAERIESSEHRAGMAITGVEHSVREAVARIEAAERDQVSISSRFESAVSETRTAQIQLANRLKRVEAEANGPRSAEALRALEVALGKVAGHLYEGEARTRRTLEALRERVDRAETAATTSNVEAIEDVVNRIGEQFAEAETRTAEALAGLKSSFTSLDGRLDSIESTGSPALERRFGEISTTLTEHVETARSDLNRKLEAATEGRFDRIERKLSEMTDQVRAAEQRSAQSIERMGKEVSTVAETLNRRVQQSEQHSAEAIGQVSGEVSRIGDNFETRLNRNDSIQAEAMEKLGAEISRISERLADRIGAAERRSAQAIDEVSDQVARVNEQIGHQGVKAADDFAERIRLSEERTAKLLDEARETIDQRLSETHRDIAEKVAATLAPPAVEPLGDHETLGEPEPFPTRETHFSTPESSLPTGLSGMAGYATRSGFASPSPQPRPVAAERFETPRIDLPDPEPFAQPDPFVRFDSPVEEDQQPVTNAAELERPTFDLADFEAADEFEHPAADVFDDAEPEMEAQAPITTEEEAVAETASFEHQAFDDHPGESETENLAGEASEAELPEEIDHFAGEDQPALDVAAADIAEEPARILTTREVIEQARAAARTAIETDANGKKGRLGLPRLHRGESFFSLFGARPKRQAGSSLQSALVIVGAGAAISLGAAGFVLMDGRPGGGPPERVARALAALSADKTPEVGKSEADTTPFPATPRVALALAPQTAVPTATDMPSVPDLSERFAKAADALTAKTPGALDELKAVADLGHAPAQFYLAKLYETGEGGVKRDLAQARRWTERAAEDGDRRAMHNLGISFIEGTGGPKNSTTAAQWFRRAAELGLVDSQYNLAALYERGLGVSQNTAEAYRWYLIAAKTGDGAAKKRADQVRAQLNPDARVVAERAAAAFRPSQPNPSTAPNAVAELGTDAAGAVTVQKALSRLGYYQGPTDGSASPALKLALAAYQRDQNLAPTGVLDPATLSRLSVFTR